MSTQIDPTDFKRMLTRAILLPLFLAAALAGVFFWQINRLLAAARWVEHTDEVIARAQEAQRLLVDQETGLRGFLLTGNPEFLEPYDRATAEVAPALEALARLVADNESQVARLNAISSTRERWLTYSRDTLAIKNGGGNYLARVNEGEGKRLMDASRREFTEFIRFEESLRDERSRDTRRATYLAVGTGAALALLLGIIVAAFTRRQMLAVSRNYAQALATEQEQRELLRVTLSSIGDAVIATDDEGRINFMNAVAESVTRWKKEEAAGKPLPEVFRIINEQSRQTVESPADRVLREGVIVGLANHTLLVAKDGTEVPIDDSGAPIRDASGKVAGVVLVFRDITERKVEERERERLQQETREAEAARMKLQEEVIRMQAARLEELSTPLIPLRREIIMMPLIGATDSERAVRVLDSLSRGVVERGARVAIIDITGVSEVDTHAAGMLMQAAQMVRLLGAEVVLTGIRPRVAQALVGLGVDLGDLVTRKDLQSGIAYALEQLSAESS